MAAASFVIDNSVAMYWPLPDKTKPAQLAYAAAVLESLQNGATATVPLLWHLEAIHVLVQAERGEPKAKRRKPIRQAVTQAFWETIAALEFETVSILHGESVTALARQYSLSPYDAAYLDIAMRRGLPLASVDDDLCAAAKKAGVAPYLGGY